MALLPLDDPQYEKYYGGYKTPYNVAPKLKELSEKGASSEFWDEIWQELYHQDDVGEASYAAIPYLVEYQSSVNDLDEDLVNFVVSVELASHEPTNPSIPQELEFEYAKAIRKLPYVGMEKLRRGCSKEAVMLIAAATAVSVGEMDLAKAYLEMTPEHAKEFIENMLSSD